VDVVDAEQERRSPPKVRGQPVEPVQDRERGVEQRVGGVIPRRREAEQPRRVPGRAGQELSPFRRRGRDQRGLEQLADQAIREVSFEFRTARVQRRQAKLAGVPSGRQYQAGLADARRALDQEQRTAPGDRFAQAPTDQGKGGVSFEKRLPAIHRRHRRPSYRRQNSSVHLRKSTWSATVRH